MSRGGSFPTYPFLFYPLSFRLRQNLLTLGNSNRFDCARLLADFSFLIFSFSFLIMQEYLNRLNIAELSPMQQTAYDEIINKNNVSILSPTGSGKTLAFLLPLLKRLNPNPRPGAWPQAVVVTPSRELAQQIDDVFKRMKTNFASMSLCGGRSAMEAARVLKEVKPAVVFVTPGRLNDHIKRKDFDPGIPTILVVDEFDKCLELGFKKEMDVLVKELKFIKQTVFTSATLPNAESFEVDSLLLSKFQQAVMLNFCVAQNEVVNKTIEWNVVHSESNDKLETLAALLTHLKGEPTIVFVSHRESVDRVASYLKGLKFACSKYHGGMEQQNREREVYSFRAGSTNVLISTDLAARGLDIPEVRSIVHYHLPINQEAFVHRCGRTARWDADGNVFTILNPKETLPGYYPDFSVDLTLDVERVSPTAPKFTSIYIGKGKKDKISKMDIVGFLCKKGGLNATDIGRIDVDKYHAFAAINTQKVKRMLNDIAREKIKGQSVLIEIMR